MKVLFNAVGVCASLALAGQALACSQDELRHFIASAQVLDKAAVADGQKLLRCPDQKAAALQWQAFLLALTGDRPGSLRLDDVPPVRGAKARDDVLARARAGAYQELLRRVDSQEPGYANAGDAQLVLARVLTRKGFFGRGREAYVVYLRQAPDDDEAEAEYLYSFLWEGRYADAEAQLAAASRWDSKPEFAMELQRARALLARLSGVATAAAGSAPAAAFTGVYRGSYALFSVPGAYGRRTEQVDYSGSIDAQLAAHQVDSPAFGSDGAHADEASAGATWTGANGLSAAAHAGFYSAGSDHWFGDVSAGGTLPAGFGAALGGYRAPLALLVPLPPDADGLMRDGIYATAHVRRFVELRLELQKEKGYAPHEAHSVIGRVPLTTGGAPGDGLYLRLPASLEVNPRPNPNYASNPQQVLVGGGVELAQSLAGRAALALTADYSLAFITTRANAEMTHQTGIATAVAALSVPLVDALRAVVAGHYVRAGDTNLVAPKDRVSSLSLGLSYGAPDGPR